MFVFGVDYFEENLTKNHARKNPHGIEVLYLSVLVLEFVGEKQIVARLQDLKDHPHQQVPH